MKYAIFKLQEPKDMMLNVWEFDGSEVLTFESSYEASAPHGIHERAGTDIMPFKLHLEVPQALDADCVKAEWDANGLMWVCVADQTKVDTKAAALALAQEEAAMELKKARRKFGEKVIDKIAVVNDSKSLTVPQVVSFMSHAGVKAIDALLRSGSLETAKAQILALNFSDAEINFWTEADRTVIINMINASGYVA